MILYIDCGLTHCTDTTIHCTNNAQCVISCPSYESCRGTSINGHSASSLSVSAQGANNYDMNITCPNSGSCDINCAGTFQNCFDAYINASSSSSMVLTCGGNANQCSYIDLYCPYSGPCKFVIDANISGLTLSLSNYPETPPSYSASLAIKNRHRWNEYLCNLWISLP